jgi:hypothetical protein
MDAEAGKLHYENGSESGGGLLTPLCSSSLTDPQLKKQSAGREIRNENKTTLDSSDIQPKGNASLGNA